MDVVFAPLGIDESKNKRRYLNGQVIIQEQFPAFTAAVKARMTTMANAFTTEVNWQAEKTNSKLGQCGKFVVDDTAGTIRLPCVVNAQGLVDLALIGGIKSESLPNITGSVTAWNDSDSQRTDFGIIGGKVTGAFTRRPGYRNGAVNPTSITADNRASNTMLGFDASRSSSTYQNNAPVQQEAVQYPYCIVVNTGVEESDRPINNYQVNNVYSYGMSQYYKGIMNNNSWLKSAGQWNDGTVYTGMYNWLLEQRNAELKTMYGWHRTTDTQIAFLTLTNTLSVGTEFYGYVPNVKAGTITAISGNNVTGKNDIDNTTDTTAIDVSDPVLIENQYIYDTTKVNIITKSELDNWRGSINTSDYDFVINTENQTFRLPLLNGSEDLPSDRKTSLTIRATGSSEIAPANGFYCLHASNNTSSLEIYVGTSTNFTLHATTQDSSGWNGIFVNVSKGDRIEYYYAGTGTPDVFQFIYAKGNGSLYYYIGDTLQNAQLINVARIEETLVTKTNKVQAAEASMPSVKSIKLTVGASGTTYTAPANGWFYICVLATANGATYNMYEVNGVQGVMHSNLTANKAYKALMPIIAGRSLYFGYNDLDFTSHDYLGLWFIYAQGDQ